MKNDCNKDITQSMGPKNENQPENVWNRDRKVPDLKVFPNLPLDTPRLKDLWRDWVEEHATLEELMDDELGEKAFKEYAGLKD